MWVTIRKATEQDAEILERKAFEFMRRHDDPANFAHMYTMLDAVTYLIEEEAENDKSWGTRRASYLRSLWKRIVPRALNAPGAEGIAYGAVGYHQD